MRKRRGRQKGGLYAEEEEKGGLDGERNQDLGLFRGNGGALFAHSVVLLAHDDRCTPHTRPLRQYGTPHTPLRQYCTQRTSAAHRVCTPQARTAHPEPGLYTAIAHPLYTHTHPLMRKDTMPQYR